MAGIDLQVEFAIGMDEGGGSRVGGLRVARGKVHLGLGSVDREPNVRHVADERVVELGNLGEAGDIVDVVCEG